METRFRTPYTITDGWSKLFGTENNEDDMTQQSDLAETDINIIMKKFGQSGQMPQALDPALGGDFTEVGDYRECVEKIQAADKAFAELPAQVRKEFDNDPGKFIEYASNPENIDTLREMGLAPQPKPKETTLEDINNTLRARNDEFTRETFTTEYDDNGSRTTDKRPTRHEPTPGPRGPSGGRR